MADAEVRMHAEVVEAALRAGIALPSHLVHALRDTALMIGTRIQARAQDRAPEDSGTLKRSAHTTGQPAGADFAVTVTFGGLAEKYAEVQHENPTLTHTKEAWWAKYGVVTHSVLSTRAVVSRATIRTSLKTRRTSVYGARGKRIKLPGHKGGQAHFLHGAPTSAWNGTAQRWATGRLDQASAIVADRALRGSR